MTSIKNKSIVELKKRNGLQALWRKHNYNIYTVHWKLLIFTHFLWHPKLWHISNGFPVRRKLISYALSFHTCTVCLFYIKRCVREPISLKIQPLLFHSRDNIMFCYFSCSHRMLYIVVNWFNWITHKIILNMLPFYIILRIQVASIKINEQWSIVQP